MNKHSKNNNTRFCAGCRKEVEKDYALRWFLDPNNDIWPDWTGRSRKIAKRGASTHANTDCISNANQQGGFQRALKTNFNATPSVKLFQRAILLGENAFFNRLGLALRAKMLFVGAIAVREGFKKSVPVLLILSSNAGNAVQQRTSRNAFRKSCSIVEVSSGFRLAKALGREFVSVALLKNSSFGRTLVAWSFGLCSLDAPNFVRYLDSSDNTFINVGSGFVG